MRAEVFLNKGFEGRKALGGAIFLLKAMKWSVRECRCLCDTVWHSHIGNFNCHLIIKICGLGLLIIVIICVIEYIVTSLIVWWEFGTPPQVCTPEINSFLVLEPLRHLS